ncbi:MAG TPA: hypothetical protein PLT32_00880 [bacterium]|nr:hypothetical protein [bacterium]
MEKVVMTSGNEGVAVANRSKVLFTKILNDNDLEKVMFFLD